MDISGSNFIPLCRIAAACARFPARAAAGKKAFYPPQFVLSSGPLRNQLPSPATAGFLVNIINPGKISTITGLTGNNFQYDK
jgi:hypothetical protein